MKERTALYKKSTALNQVYKNGRKIPYALKISLFPYHRIRIVDCSFIFHFNGRTNSLKSCRQEKMTKKGLKQFEVATKSKKERDEFSVSNSIPLTFSVRGERRRTCNVCPLIKSKPSETESIKIVYHRCIASFDSRRALPYSTLTSV